MKKIAFQSICVIALFVLVCAKYPLAIQAVTPTPTTTTATDETTATGSATTEELRKRIEKVVDEKREQIKGVIQDLLSKKTSFIGEISRISEEAITVKSADTTTIIPISDSLKLLKDNKALEVSALEVGNWAVVLGNKDGDGIESEYILVSKESLRPRNQLVVLGSITALTKTEVTISTRGTQEERKLTIAKTSEFQDVNGEKAVAGDFEKDFNVLVVATEEEKGWQLQTLRSLAAFEEEADN
jgi:hypothetical protein